MTKRKKYVTLNEKPVEHPDVALQDRDRDLLAKHIERLETATVSPSIRIDKDDQSKLAVKINHPNPTAGFGLLMEALGVEDYDFGRALLSQIVTASSVKGTYDEVTANFLLSVIKGRKPRDQTEALLALQTANVHAASIRLSGQLGNAATLEEQESIGRQLNQCSRTFVDQVEALKRIRSAPEPNVTVQNVSITDGGQAIVAQLARGAVTTPQPMLTDTPDSANSVLEGKAEELLPAGRKTKPK
jgi:hypothetical protein